jgi:hypothetical protein
MSVRSAVVAAAGLLVVLALAVAGRAAPSAIDPSDFASRVTNPWFPLEPGTVYVYRGVKDGQASRDVVTVSAATKLIQGVRATVVHDRLYLAGRLRERTTDWYAQDRRGRVWYFGETTAELDRKEHVTSREGSWQSGVGGAEAGIFMPAHPKVGRSFRQEYYKGHAEDHFSVLSLGAPIRVPFVRSSRALLTKEWTPLEPDVLDHKYYVRGIGMVKEASVRGPREVGALVSVKRP